MSAVQLKEPKSAYLKPPLKWAGGKRWLVSHLGPLWEPHKDRRYVEPFCGGLAVALGLRPDRALLNDVNPHLINFYRQLQKGLRVRREMHNNDEFYYSYRRRFNELVREGLHTSKEAAELFYYLNRTCFNGLCRFNQTGEFNVPFGSYKSINYESDFREYQSVLDQWTFSNCDIRDLKLEPYDFVYADPPYDVEFTSYSAGGFSWNDQVRTVEILSAHPGPVVISNQATGRIVDLYKQHGYELRRLEGPRRISCTGDRTAAKEILALRNVL